MNAASLADDYTPDKEVTPVMVKHITTVLNYIKTEVRPGNDREYIEERVYLPRVGYGTVDYGAVHGLKKSGKCKLVSIVDLKYGKGIAVTANGPQTPYYALGLIFHEKLRPERVRVAIHQPRLGGVDTKDYTYKEIIKMWKFLAKKKKVVEKMDRFFADPSKHHKLIFKPGSHCQFCRARVRCRAVAEFIQNDGPLTTLDYVESLEARTGAEKDRQANNIAGLLNEEELGKHFMWCDLATRTATAVKDRCTELAAAGVKFSELKMVAGRASRSWSDEEKAKYALKISGVSEEQMYTKKLISVAQAEKIAPINEGLVVKSKGKATLVPKSDRRKEIDPYNVASAVEGFEPSGD